MAEKRTTDAPDGGFVLVAGAAFLTARSNESSRTKDNSLKLELDGVGFNAAINLSQFGVSTTFATALYEHPISDMVKRELSNHNVRLQHFVREENKGQIEAKISHALDNEARHDFKVQDVGTILFEKKFVERSAKKAKAIVLDAALSPKTIRRFCDIAAKSNIPVHAIANQENQANLKGCNISQVYLHGKNETDFDCVAFDQSSININNEKFCDLPKGALDRPGVLEFISTMAIHTQIEDEVPLVVGLQEAAKKIKSFIKNDKPNEGSVNTVYEHIKGVKDQALRDPMTGAYNRLAMRNFVVDLEHQTDIHLSAIMLDLDNFKGVNDTHGHGAGDEIIKAFSSVIMDTVREGDIVVRDGGDEFLCLLKTSLNTARSIAERIREKVEESKFVVEVLDDVTKKQKKVTIQTTSSLGVSQRIKTEEIDDFIFRADQALYAAKANDKNQVHVSEG